MREKRYKVVGVMSGTSLDGLDMAYCEFVKGRKWSYTIPCAETKKYTEVWRKKLVNAYLRKPGDTEAADREFGHFIGREVEKFIRKKGIDPEFIASHGHTVFHRPDKGMTVQIGSGEYIFSECGLPVVFDFRSGDVALGGQGAPLVPLADRLLFSNYRYCLNLGGFANISYEDGRGKRKAFDICPVNIVLNELAEQTGKEFDKNGQMASAGKIIPELLRRLNALLYYKSSLPKSLGREWVEAYFLPVLYRFRVPVADMLRTVCEHIAVQVAVAVRRHQKSGNEKMLVTGGGVYNTFLMQCIEELVQVPVVVPDDQTIQFKEAMAFAFLGVLRKRGEINILKSVTGARKDSSGGRIFPDDQNRSSS